MFKTLQATGSASANISMDVTDISAIHYTLTAKTGSDTRTNLAITGAMTYTQMFYNQTVGTSFTIDCSSATGDITMSLGYSTIRIDSID